MNVPLVVYQDEIAAERVACRVDTPPLQPERARMTEKTGGAQSARSVFHGGTGGGKGIIIATRCRYEGYQSGPIPGFAARLTLGVALWLLAGPGITDSASAQIPLDPDPINSSTAATMFGIWPRRPGLTAAARAS